MSADEQTAAAVSAALVEQKTGAAAAAQTKAAPGIVGGSVDLRKFQHIPCRADPPRVWVLRQPDPIDHSKRFRHLQFDVQSGVNDDRKSFSAYGVRFHATETGADNPYVVWRLGVGEDDKTGIECGDGVCAVRLRLGPAQHARTSRLLCGGLGPCSGLAD
jgi:hypothetical protein